MDRSLADDRVQDLIDRIQGNKDPHVPDVAENMTLAFISLYQRVIQAYKNMMNVQPPPPPAQVQAMQAQIDQLQQKIDVLNRFCRRSNSIRRVRETHQPVRLRCGAFG